MDSTSIDSLLNSVRHRVIRNALANLKAKSPSDSDLPPLKPGEMQLYSYFTPGISTGRYDITAEQTILTSDNQSKTITAPAQSFIVDAPKFSIDPALIHSTFPLQGVAAQANVLPHVVLNDPHLPWQTKIGKTSEQDTLRIPWLAVVVFEQSELKLQPNDPLFPSSLQGEKLNPPQSFTMTTRLTVEQLVDAGFQCAFPDLREDMLEDSSLLSKSIDVIFPNMDLFLALFGSKAADDTPVVNLDRFKYLAHARNVNTTHMTDSAVLDGGQFSIVFSHRTGPPFEKSAPPQPKRCVAHLVSLDWVHRIPSSTLKSTRAALLSLFSWTYDCIPPETINFEGVMKAVGQNSGIYRTPDDIRNEVSKNLPQAIRHRVKDRLDDGYTLLRYRVQTGEETVALMRGPLTPYQVPEASWMDIHSNTGEDLQIIDTQLGLMDISYCAAWQLGKSLAIADQAFCAALIRIRASVYDTSNEKAKEDTLSKKFEAATSKRVISALPQHFPDMKQLSKESPNDLRWNRPSLIQSRYKLLAEGKDSAAYKRSEDHHLRRQVELLASATDGTHHTEVKDPQSTDWDLVLNWILDRIYLEKISPWYLIPDPTWLPAESIRFFYVDHKWLSALVDGALSVANHLDAQDKARQAIKDQLLRYLNEDFHPELKHPPQVPSYGFYLRSVVVDAFPDLVVRARWPASPNGQPDLRAEILRQENVRKDIMFCLLDRTPKDLSKGLILSQPPHQQCFMFGQDSTFTTDGFDLALRKVYSVRTKKHMDELPEKPFLKDSDGLCDIYNWNTRTIRVEGFVNFVSNTLKEEHGKDSKVYDGEVNASLIGIELNDPIYRLTFTSTSTQTSPSMHRASDRHSVVFGFPTGPEAADARPPMKSYARPFKGAPRIPNKIPFHGQPRRSRFSLPPLSNSPTADPPAATVSQLSTAPEIPSVLSGFNYDDIEKCSIRFSPTCFPLGYALVAVVEDAETKYINSSPNGSDIIIRLARNEADLSSTDYIHIFEIRAPLGDTSDCLFTKPLDMDGVQMLNTMRLVTRVGICGNDDKKEVIIHLTPKAVLEDSERSPLSHNPDMSFIIKGAEINPKALDSTISIVELYKSKQGNTKVALNYIHHIQAVEEEL